MSARDELAVLLANHESMGCGCCAYGPTTPDQSKAADALEVSDYMVVLADAILAAGYSKPRTITTAEELDALPVGAVVLDLAEWLFRKQVDARYVAAGSQGLYSADAIDLPATILHEGAQS